MKFTFILFSILTTLSLFSCNKTESDSAPGESISPDSVIRRGEYLVNTIGCRDCHSPKREGPHGPEIIQELDLSGFQAGSEVPSIDHPNNNNGWILFSPDLTTAVGPWGQSFAGNITSDATGIGNWTEENFMRALREGKSKGLPGARDLLPPMPWFVYKNLSDQDLKAIFAYLQTTPPVQNIVPAPKAPDELVIKKP